jgi:hypothetical protein
MFDRSDPAMFWLSVTNAALGIVVAICVGAVLYGVARDILERVRARAGKGHWGHGHPRAKRS